jgi:hypothetical protein
MDPFIQFKNASPLIVIALMSVCTALLPKSQAVSPAPDGGYANENTAEGTNALFSLTTGDHNTANGFEALFHNTTGSGNTASGHNTLQNNTIGSHNTANGGGVLVSNTTGSGNTGNGRHALNSNTIGNANTADGHEALYSNTTGSSNIALGYEAGYRLTTGSNNIDIGNIGVAGAAHTIRIGNVVATVYPDGTTHPAQTATFIAGIHGATVAGTAVIVNNLGQLGVAPSSARFKDEIKPMDKASEAILALKPVAFRYKKDIDPDGTPQFGLVAEDVAKVNPDLVVRDAQGKVYTVRYEAVNAMLLNEFLKEHRKVEQLKNDLQATVAQEQKEIQALTAQLKEQAAQIQKVSAQLEASRPAPQLVQKNQ